MVVDTGTVPGMGTPPPIGTPVAGLIGGAPGIPVPGTPPGTALVKAPPGLTGIVPAPPGIPPGIIVEGGFAPVPGTALVVTPGTAGAGTPATA